MERRGCDSFEKDCVPLNNRRRKYISFSRSRSFISLSGIKQQKRCRRGATSKKTKNTMSQPGTLIFTSFQTGNVKRGQLMLREVSNTCFVVVVFFILRMNRNELSTAHER